MHAGKRAGKSAWRVPYQNERYARVTPRGALVSDLGWCIGEVTALGLKCEKKGLNGSSFGRMVEREIYDPLPPAHHCIRSRCCALVIIYAVFVCSRSGRLREAVCRGPV